MRSSLPGFSVSKANAFRQIERINLTLKDGGGSSKTYTSPQCDAGDRGQRGSPGVDADGPRRPCVLMRLGLEAKLSAGQEPKTRVASATF